MKIKHTLSRKETGAAISVLENVGALRWKLEKPGLRGDDQTSTGRDLARKRKDVSSHQSNTLRRRHRGERWNKLSRRVGHEKHNRDAPGARAKKSRQGVPGLLTREKESAKVTGITPSGEEKFKRGKGERRGG